MSDWDGPATNLLAADVQQYDALTTTGNVTLFDVDGPGMVLSSLVLITGSIGSFSVDATYDGSDVSVNLTNVKDSGSDGYIAGVLPSESFENSATVSISGDRFGSTDVYAAAQVALL